MMSSLWARLLLSLESEAGARESGAGRSKMLMEFLVAIAACAPHGYPHGLKQEEWGGCR
jgi:hypothetical protein